MEQQSARKFSDTSGIPAMLWDSRENRECKVYLNLKKMNFNELNMKMNNTHCAVALEFALMLNAIYFAFIYIYPL